MYILRRNEARKNSKKPKSNAIFDVRNSNFLKLATQNIQKQKLPKVTEFFVWYLGNDDIVTEDAILAR